MNIIRQANSNPAVYAVLFVLISLLNTSWGQSALLTLSTIITLTWTESGGLMNQRERERSVQLSRNQFIVLLLSCKRRDRSCATGLSVTPHIFSPSPFPLSPPLVSLSFTLPLFSVTAHIWFWVKARLVSSGMEGFYFSMAPIPLQFHSAVKSMQFVYELVFLSLYWYYSILIFIIGEPHNHPQLMAGRVGMLVGWWSSRLSCGALLSVISRWLCISRNCVHPRELLPLDSQYLSPKTLSASN